MWVDEYTPASPPAPAPEIWNVLQVRILVMASLCLQVLLIVFGNRRKYKVSPYLQFFLWFFYLSADWVATVALGILSKVTKDHRKDPNFKIMAIWAPFLLVHLGGPDTITAYSLEDNELWPRHMLGLLYQLAVALYVVYCSWKAQDTKNHESSEDRNSVLNFVTIPILVMVAGIIKYGERTWSLWCGSSKGFRYSILTPPDPGPNYAKFMDDYTAKKAEGYDVQIGEVMIETTINTSTSTSTTDDQEISNASSSLQDGFKFYKIPEYLFADLILSFQDHKSSQIFFQSTDWKHAFEVIAVELGLVYDKLYTKAVITYSRPGIFLKFVSFFSTLIALSCLIFTGKDKSCHRNYDKIITFVLFIGAMLLEIYAVIVLLCSNQAVFWLSERLKKNKRLVYLLLSKSIPWFQYCFRLSRTKMWSNQMSQFNLIRFCLKGEPPKCIKIQKLLRIYKQFREVLLRYSPSNLEKSYYQKMEKVHPELKKLIFNRLREKSEEATDIGECKKLCAQKGDRVLEKFSCDVPEIKRSIKEVEFDQSILLWHIATDLLYYSSSSDPPSVPNDDLKFQSLLLSDYMLDLLVTRPFLLPNGIGQIRFEDTCAEVDELLKERKYISQKDQVCKMILRVNTEIPPSKVKGDRSKSVLFDACRLAKALQSLETEEGWSKEKKWKMISDVWVEILSHAASQCRELQHAKQLSKGGELLTHVWLLMAHLGITEQFQISQGHARAKLKLG